MVDNINHFICLGINALGECKYDPSMPGLKLISIGDFIATIALIVTFSQFLTPLKKLKISRNLNIYKIILIICTLCLLFSSALPFIPGTAIPLLEYPIFWEFICTLLILFCLFKGYINYESKLKFNKNEAKYIIKLSEEIILTVDEKNYCELAKELLPIIPDLALEYKDYDNNMKEKKWNLNEDLISLIRILSDKDFCSITIEKYPQFSKELFFHFKKEEFVYKSELSFFVREIIKQSLLNINSILYRENHSSGLGDKKEFTKLSFCDYRFAEKFYIYAEFESSLYTVKNINIFKKYFKCMEMTLNSFIDQRTYFIGYQAPLALISSVKSILEFSRENMLYIRQDVNYKQSFQFEYLFQLFNFIGNTLDICLDKITKFYQDDNEEDKEMIEKYIYYYSSKFDQKNGDHSIFDEDYSIFEIMANLIFNYFIIFSYSEQIIHENKHYLKRLIQNLYYSHDRNIIQNEIIKRFEYKCIQQIDENLTRGFYPALSVTLIYIFGINYQFKENDNLDLFKKNFLDLLKNKFKALFLNSKENALKHLPSHYMYNEMENKIIDKTTGESLMLE